MRRAFVRIPISCGYYQTMSPLGDNPFTVLTLIAAPAVLTNATSVLALGTSNRFARAVDRARALSTLLEMEKPGGDSLMRVRIRQLARVETRAITLLHALTTFYVALGSFAASALITLIGASLAASTHYLLFRVTIGLGLFAGSIGVGGLVFGCSLLVHETRLAVLNMTDEAKYVQERYAEYLVKPKTTIEPG